MRDSKNRIIFLDLMRAFAVLMMVQGHTIHTVLDIDLRTNENTFYFIWHFMRGFTAPIFMFTAGVVFTYLLNLNNLPFNENPRIKKGIKRFFLLLILGYALHYPTYKIIDFSGVTQKQMYLFFSSDALHLIGFGILFIIVLRYFAEKINIDGKIIYFIATLTLFIIAPIFKNYNFLAVLPAPIAAYLNYDTGSFFPLIPWAGYVLSGGILGKYLAQNPGVQKKSSFSKYLFLIGFVLLMTAVLIVKLENLFYNNGGYWIAAPSVPFYRLGAIIILNSAVSYFAQKLNKIPNIIFLAGRHTLLIYVVHLIILYGCVFFPGIYSSSLSRSLNSWQSIFSAIIMIFLMCGLVLIIEKIKKDYDIKPIFIKIRKLLSLPGYS
ncbi:MAG: DUF1624 domain-containing protein [Bacteroidetes bacterium]|nr:DUF1624 domain-containing protein [Bacteroidota bacterium]